MNYDCISQISNGICFKLQLLIHNDMGDTNNVYPNYVFLSLIYPYIQINMYLRV